MENWIHCRYRKGKNGVESFDFDGSREDFIRLLTFLEENSSGADDLVKKLTSGPWARWYDHDSENGAVALKGLSQGEVNVPDAIILILYGYKLLVNAEYLPVVRLTSALKASDLKTDRTHRRMKSYREQGLIVSRGEGKGTSYGLSDIGHNKAESLLQELTEYAS